MRPITKEEAERTEHSPECQGYEDCDCFSRRHDHKDIYMLQQRIAVLASYIAVELMKDLPP
jgi:hypothetical protein